MTARSIQCLYILVLALSCVNLVASRTNYLNTTSIAVTSSVPVKSISVKEHASSTHHSDDLAGFILQGVGGQSSSVTSSQTSTSTTTKTNLTSTITSPPSWTSLCTKSYTPFLSHITWQNQSIPPNSCCGTKEAKWAKSEFELTWEGCQLSAGTIKISYWPTLNNYSYPSTIYDSELDYTFTSPSVYLIINTLMAANKCGDETRCQIGPTARDAIFAMDLTDVKTLVPTDPSKSVSRASLAQLKLNDLATDCPQTPAATYAGPQKHWEMVQDYESYTMDRENRCNPRLAIPMAIKQYGYPYWKHCNFFGNQFGWFDPPGAVPSVAGYLPTTATATTTAGSEPEETSVEAFPSAAKSLPSVTRASATRVSTDVKSIQAKPTRSASNAQEQPDADTDNTAAEGHSVSTPSSQPNDPQEKSSDGIAKSEVAAVVDIFKSGATRSVVPASSANRPSADTNPTASADAGAHENESNPKDRTATKVQDEKSDASNAGAHSDNSNPNNQAATKAENDESDASNSAAHEDDSDPKEQTVSESHEGESDPSNSATHKDDGDRGATKAQDDETDSSNGVAHEYDSDPKQTVDNPQDVEESNTSNSAAQVLAGIFDEIAHDDPAGSEAANRLDDTHSAAGVSIDSSENSESSTADGDDDPLGQQDVKSPADPSQSIAKTDGDSDEQAAQGIPGIGASHESGPDQMSGTPALGQPTHAAADGSTHPPSTETDAVPKWTTVNGHVVSASAGAQHAASAGADPVGDSEADESGDSDVPSSSAETENHDQADRVAGSLTDESDSSPDAAGAGARASNSDSDSAASSTRDGDEASSATTPVGPDGATTDADGSASGEESLGGATGTGTQSLPSPTMSGSNPSLSSANAQASSVPISKDENSGTRPVVGGSEHMMLAICAMVLYRL